MKNFIPPTTKQELKHLGWERPQIILVTGDSYIDSPFIGIAVLARYLNSKGFKTAVIAQPDIKTEKDIMRLGEPEILWGVTAGSLDSMVANYTASGKKRKHCDYTPGGNNNKRPDRAVIIYTNLIKRFSKEKKPVVIGGIEASLRRISHYDFWSNKIRKPILFDSKADYLIYGMAEKALLNLTECLLKDRNPYFINSLAYIAKNRPEKAIFLDSFEDVSIDKKKYAASFMKFYNANRIYSNEVIVQECNKRFMVINPIDNTYDTNDLDEISSLKFTNNLHPFYLKKGKVKALDTIKFSLITHRGCYGECNFCAITLHQGRRVVKRSIVSLVNEAEKFIKDRYFKGIINDVGGPSANMYGIECSLMSSGKKLCSRKNCIFPEVCENLKIDHGEQIKLLDALRKLKGIKKVFVNSGIRYDLINNDINNGEKYLERIIKYHTSGQLKIAPEHVNYKVLYLMGKPGKKALAKFKKSFDKINNERAEKRYLTYYFIAAHPGSTIREMAELKKYLDRKLKIKPEQVQIFTPTPLTVSSLMYWTEKNPFNNKLIFVERKLKEKEKQKHIICS